MLIQFSVGNYRSFKDLSVFSMVASNTKSRDPQVNIDNTIKTQKLDLLTSTAIYGANASGKSNFVRALAVMKDLVLSSASSQVDAMIPVESFLLSTETEHEPSFFEIVFLIDREIQYRYGFEVNSKKIVSEWLFSSRGEKESRCFTREESAIDSSIKYFKEGKGLGEKTRPNALFLSVAAQFNGEISLSILKWFKRIAIVSGLDDSIYRGYTINQVSNGKFGEDIINLVKNLDFQISNIEINKLFRSDIKLPESMPIELRSLINDEIQKNGIIKIKTEHQKLDKDGNPVDTVQFDLDNNESAGTQKAFFLAGPIISVLKRGDVLVIDEMEARLHPLLTRNLIQLFNSKETNPNNAQMIFTTHDTNLLSNKIFRRDQIWFIEKDKYNSSRLYSLAEIVVNENKVRNDASFEDDYLKGRYGAVPYLNNIRRIIIDEDQNNANE